MGTKVGKLEGMYWVWPDGFKTHIRFIGIAVRKYQPLPRGFYAAAARTKGRNLKLLVAKAKHLGLKCTVDRPKVIGKP